MDIDPSVLPLQAALRASRPSLAGADAASRVRVLRDLARDGLGDLPLPGSGATLRRWRALAAVAATDLALAKLYEGHTDALAILAEADEPQEGFETLWAMWAAEAPGARVTFEERGDGRCTLAGVKAWCSGARRVDAALLTAWHPDGRGPFLVRVPLAQPGVSFIDSNWHAVGMAASESVDVRFDGAVGRLVGTERCYLERAGFWQGGAGIAACWHGGACALADALRAQVAAAGAHAGWHRLLALGAIDRTLSANAALLREAAAWIDAHPRDDAQAWALRTRSAADAACERVLHHATRALGAAPLCRDAVFARLAADLPVFVRQCHGDRDLAALGQQAVDAEAAPWRL